MNDELISSNLNSNIQNDDNDDSDFNRDDFTFIQDANGDIKAGGYKLTTPFAGKGAMVGGKKTQTGGSNAAISATLKDLAVPAGLFYLQQNFNGISKPYESAKQINKKSLNAKSGKGKNSGKVSYDTDFVVSENMFDKLLGMVQLQDKKIVDIKTRKRRGAQHKKTRKNRKNLKNRKN